MIGVAIAFALLAPTCYRPPVATAIVDPFRAPACTFCPGNRGLEYQPPAGTPVVAAADGVVRFSGAVAGVRYVVVEQRDRRTATYGRLAAAQVTTDAVLRAGDVIGTTTDGFYFGLREGDRYIDPAPFLASPRYRRRLLPVDGSGPRPPPSPTMRCAAPQVGVGERAPRR
ncbi:MAG: M23 family metallopeptidase [Ilumatobacteraceae bacterium]